MSHWNCSWNSTEFQLKFNWFCMNSWISTVEICFQLLFNLRSTVKCKLNVRMKMNTRWKWGFSSWTQVGTQTSTYRNWTQVKNWNLDFNNKLKASTRPHQVESLWRFMTCIGHINHACMHTHMHMCVHMRLNVCLHVHVCVCVTHAYVCLLLRTCMFACMHVYVYAPYRYWNL